MQSNCTDFFKEHFTFWEDLTQAQRDLLCIQTSFGVFEKGKIIHGSSDACTGVVLVKSGTLRTYMLSEEGKEITLYRLFAGDICMLSASCVLQTITFEVVVEAEQDSEVYIINPKAFLDLMEENIHVENFALKATTQRFSEVMWTMQQILFTSFDRRLAVFLTNELSKQDGDMIKLTQEQIAKYMGSAREVVSRMLKYFSGEGLVEVTRGGVKVLDRAGIKLMAGM